MEPLRIHLFGGFFLERGGLALPPIASRVGRSVLAYLVMHSGRPLQRDYLAGTFWPDLPEGRARRRLSHTLWQIQDVVNVGSTSHLDVTTDTMAFNASNPYWVDVDEFDRNFAFTDATRVDNSHRGRLDATALRTCVELYRGDFLAGYFDDWVLVEQDHYRQRYLTALRRLVDATKASGDYEEALALARRLTHHDPLSEDAHREVMRLCYILGRASDAVEQFKRCRSVLEEELDAKPSPPTVELYERIVKQRRAGIRPLNTDDRSPILGKRSDSPFVGREEEKGRLIDSLERVLAGPGGVVLVEGEPGVGKTRLGLEVADDAQWRGFEVSWGTCTPGAVRPFAPLIEVLESLSPLRLEQLSEQVEPVWLSQALRLAPRLSDRVSSSGPSAQLRPAEELTRMQEALVHTLGALGEIAPHLVIIDDVHWADQDTLGVLTQLGARLANSRILVMLVYRSEEARGDVEVWDVMRGLDRAAGLGRVVLSPLSVFELEEMVRRMLGLARLQPAVAARLHRETGGNALFTLETLLALRDRGLFDSGTDPVTVLEAQMADRSIPVAPRVRSVIEARLSLLHPDVSAVYEMAAVLGDRLDLSLLEAATELPRATVLDAMDELLHRGLIQDDGSGRFRMTHDQVRQVVYEGIARPRRMNLHQVIAEMLVTTEPENVEVIGHHFREGRDADQATRFLFRAGLRAVGLNAYATARHHLQSARETAVEASWSPGDRYSLVGHLEAVLGVLGRRAEQEDVLAEMEDLGISMPELSGDLARRRAWLLAHIGQLHEAEESARHSVGLETASGDATGIAASLVALGTIQRWSGRLIEAVPILEKAVEAAGDDQGQRVEALTELASTLVEVQRPREALSHLDDAVTIYREANDIRGQAEVAGIQARALNHLGERDLAAEQYELAIELCRRIGYRHGEAVNLVNRSTLDYFMTRVASALAGYDSATRIFEELGNVRGEATVLANSASARHNLLGDDDRARLDAERAMLLFAEIGDRAREAQCLEVLAGVAARAGNHDDAVGMLESSLEILAGAGNRHLEGQHLRSLAWLHLDHGDLDTALATLDLADQLCDQAGLDDLAIELTSIRGMVHLSVGRVQEALAVMREAVDRLSPGVERAYLVHHRHALAAAAAKQTGETRRAALQAQAILHTTLAGLGPEELRRAIEQVPDHRDIEIAASRYTPHTVEVDLPSAEAPIGRPLGDEERLTVTWTIEHPDDDLIASPIERRHQQLIRLLSEASDAGAAPSTEHLADALDVSASTVRRDLNALSEKGYQAATRGKRRQVS